MTVEAELADGRVLEFPDGTHPDVIQATVKKMVSTDTPNQTPQTPSVPQSNTDMAVGLLKRFGPGLLPGAPIARLGELLNSGAYEAGGRVTDALSSISPQTRANIGTGLSGVPVVGPIANQLLRDPAAAGFATNIGIQSIPVVAGGLAGSATAPVIEGAAKGTMLSAIKATPDDLLSGKAEMAAQTLLDKGLNVTRGGMSELRNQATALNDQVTSILEKSGATVNKAEVASKIQDVIKNIETHQSTPQDARAISEKVYEQCMANDLVPKEIPISQAQTLKQGIYKMVKDYYGELTTPAKESLKALGYGYRTGIEAQVPQVAPLNAEAAKLWSALNVTERRAYLELNKNPVGAFGMMMHNPAIFAAYMGDKSSAFKSLVANLLHQSGGTIPTTLGAAAGGVADAANQGVVNLGNSRP